MRVAMVSDIPDGGAAVATARLREGLLGYCKRIVISHCICDGQDVAARVLSAWMPLWFVLLERVLGRTGTHGQALSERFRKRPLSQRLRQWIASVRPDVINLHNIRLGLPWNAVEACAAQAPVVWTLHDLWAVTGYCCFPMECDRFSRGMCIADCPEFGKWGRVEKRVDREWRDRGRALRRLSGRITFVAQTEWTRKQARCRVGDEMPVELIRYGLDHDVFHPISKLAARASLGLNPKAKIILFGAASDGEPRKGWNYLQAAVGDLRRSGRNDIVVVAFGYPVRNGEQEDSVQHVGWIGEPRLLRLYYSAADVFVLPSLAETCGQVYLESFACGTPCVAFDNTACSEIVGSGERGLVAKTADSSALARAINEILTMSRDRYQVMAENGRAYVEAFHSLRAYAESYSTLFHKLSES